MIGSLFGAHGGTTRRTRRRKLGVERLDRRAMLTSAYGFSDDTCFFFDGDAPVTYDDVPVYGPELPSGPSPIPAPTPTSAPTSAPPTFQPSRARELDARMGSPLREALSDTPWIIGD